MAKGAENTNEKRTPEERQQALQKASDDLEQIVTECGVTALAQIRSPLMQTIRLADGMARMRGMLTQAVVERYFLPLQGTALGFVTDKDTSGGYNWEVVRDVVTEALMRGFQPINSEFCIIAGRFYGAKAGFERIVREFPGVTDVQYDLGVPHMAGDKGALVSFYARWFYLGEPQELQGVPASDGNPIDTRIAVRVNGGMGPDAVLGKATRKMFARIYQRLTGCSRDVVEMDPSDYVDASVAPTAVTSAPEGRRMKLGEKPAAEPPVADAAPLVREPGED